MKIISVFKKLAKYSPFIAILILSLLPVFYTWELLPIWGDTIIPFNSIGLEKYLYQWLSLQNGQYFSLNYLPYFLFFKFIELFTHNIYLISAIILFSLKVIAGLGIYKLSKLIYDNRRQALYVLPVVFYLLSPAQLHGSYYLYIYSFAPWFIYFLFKIIKRSKITIQDVIWLSIILFFSSINLPNPKYVFHLFTISIIIFIVSFFFKLIKVRFLFKNLSKIILLLLLSAYLIVPQIVFLSYYNSEKYDVHIKAEYKDEGEMMDLGDASLEKMFKLHKNTLNLNEVAKNQYNSNALVNFLSYLFVILIIANVLFIKGKDDNRKKYQYILLLLMITYLFFAAGPNPPLGFLYQRMVERFSLLAFLRTTAGATYFLSIFYALLIFPVVLNQKTVKKQNLISGLLILAFCIVGYPIINGESYKNVKVVSPNTDVTKRGIIIPKDYFDMQEQLHLIKADVKTLYTSNSFSYITTNWGFFGPPIYDFMYSTDNLDCIKIKSHLLYNIGYIFTDKSSLYHRNCSLLTVDKKNIIKQTDLLRLSSVPNDSFLPHFYIPKKIDDSNKKYLQTGVENDFETLEFKKINPTKYRIKIHSARGKLPLVFNENFHDGWQVYVADSQNVKVNNQDLINYKIFIDNEGYQVDKEGLYDYVDKGLVTDVGDKKERKIEHMKWADNERRLDFVESYTIDFISKNFQGTIQNDNLPNGSIFETWLKKPLQNNENHLMVNGYANSWNIDLDEVKKSGKYIKNEDGSIDFELIVEFWPQRMFYIGIIISSVTTIGCMGYLSYCFFIGRRRRRVGKHKKTLVDN